MVAFARVLSGHLTGLACTYRCEEATSSPPTELWLVCRELVENLEMRIKIFKGFSCRIFRRFYTVNEAKRKLFNETHNIKLKVKNRSYNEKLKEDC